MLWFHSKTIMATITLKDIPDVLHKELRNRAEAHGRSLNKEIIASLEQVTSPGRVQIPEYLSRIERLQQKIDFEVSHSEINEAIEAGRP